MQLQRTTGWRLILLDLSISESLFFFFLFPPLISRCQVILPVIQRRAETTFPPVYACNDAFVGCKQSGWAEAAICRISLWSYQTVYHHFMSVFRQGKQLTIVVAKKQIIVSFLSKLIFIVSVTPDLFPGDFSFREFCSVKFGSSHCSRSGRLNISIWLIDLYGRAQNIERIALRRNAWNEDGRPGGIYLRRPALVCVPSERAMRLKNNHHHNVPGVRENCVCGIISTPHTKPIRSFFLWRSLAWAIILQTPEMSRKPPPLKNNNWVYPPAKTDAVSISNGWVD